MIDVIALIVCFVVGWVMGYKAATKWKVKKNEESFKTIS